MLISAARFGLIVGALLAAVPALAQEAGPAADAPRLLKGSAIAPAAAEAQKRPAPGFQVAAGEDLWMIDAEAGELIACRLLNTSTVGERVIRCFADRLPRRLRD